jgi:hypothetical protein
MVVGWAPLEHHFWDQVATGRIWLYRNLSSSIAPMPWAFTWYWSSYVLHGAFLLLLLMPSLVFAFAEVTPRLESILLIAFFPLCGLLALFARESAFPAVFVAKGAPQISAWLSWAVPIGGAAGVALGCASGIPRARLAPWVRRLLAADLLWVALLQWNRLNYHPYALHVACGTLGISLLLLGEFLAARRDS